MLTILARFVRSLEFAFTLQRVSFSRSRFFLMRLSGVLTAAAAFLLLDSTVSTATIIKSPVRGDPTPTTARSLRGVDSTEQDRDAQEERGFNFFKGSLSKLFGRRVRVIPDATAEASALKMVKAMMNEAEFYTPQSLDEYLKTLNENAGILMKVAKRNGGYEALREKFSKIQSRLTETKQKQAITSIVRRLDLWLHDTKPKPTLFLWPRQKDVRTPRTL
ncbi:hypothetical protein PsorP6_007315 [Peronosclerospora sorghi]|uniref:Uncharacterized protein n=1 Tax=Peronosclerospora sorghi TaxID=230839 RepID=A0ACC0WDA3_9STRA|nr:hypothetical protein PsorP6_007315 [Peronosclerospora sorghi]